MEIIRLSYLMANRKFIISECGNDQALDHPFEEGIVFTDYDSLVDKCLYYLDNAMKRNRVAATGYEISIYEATPPIVWVFLLLSIACGIAQYKKKQGRNKCEFPHFKIPPSG